MWRNYKLGSVALAVFIILFSCNGEKKTKLAYYQSKYDFVKHEDWATIQHKNTFIENNVYGKDYLRNNHLIIFSDSNSSAFGWNWDYKYTSKRISSTPHIVLGKKVWQSCSTMEEFPARVDSIASLNYNFNYQLKTTGNVEQAIVLMFTNSAESNAEHIVLQLTIILESIGMSNIGEYIGAANFGKLTFDEYQTTLENNNFKTVILKLNNKTSNFNFDFIPYINHLINNNHIVSKNYLSSIEMGTFVKWGAGESIFQDFNYSIKLK